MLSPFYHFVLAHTITKCHLWDPEMDLTGKVTCVNETNQTVSEKAKKGQGVNELPSCKSAWGIGIPDCN